jgi:hypothetical protein
MKEPLVNEVLQNDIFNGSGFLYVLWSWVYSTRKMANGILMLWRPTKDKTRTNSKYSNKSIFIK